MWSRTIASGRGIGSVPPWRRLHRRSTLKNFIDGEFVDAADGATEPVLNPATGEPVAEMPLSTRPTSTAPWPRPRRAADGWARDDARASGRWRS